MERTGMTMYALAKAASVPPATVTRILSGVRPDPQLSTVLKLVDAVGLRVQLLPK
jgi:predicted transcriptional regulator